MNKEQRNAYRNLAYALTRAQGKSGMNDRDFGAYLAKTRSVQVVTHRGVISFTTQVEGHDFALVFLKRLNDVNATWECREA